MTSTIAIIAGAGRFPFHVAKEAKRQGCSVLALGLRGWADPALATVADTYEEIAIGQLGRLIDCLKSHHTPQAIMAGKVTKEILFDERASFDAQTLEVLSQVRDYSVTALLGAVANRLAREGVTLLDSSTFLKDHLCPDGVLTSRAPSPAEHEDIRIGLRTARALAAMDVGQTVVVRHRVVIAVEALEGTDAAIRRAHALAGKELVVVKMASPNHDRRFDLPVIGHDTIKILVESGASCLAVEAGTTLLLERPSLIAAANTAGVSLIGVVPTTP